MINSFNFDWKFYLGHYKDLTRPVIFNNKTSTFKHWARNGKYEKKKFFKYEEEGGEELWNFDWKKYVNEYPDLLVNIPYSKKSAFDHYLNHGKKQGRFPNLEEYNISIDKIRIENRKKDLITIEYLEKNYTNAVNLIYEKYLNRKADKDGLIGYIHRLEKGYDISWVIDNIKQGNEYQRICELNKLLEVKEKTYIYEFPKKINIIKRENDIKNPFIKSWEINNNFEINIIEFNKFEEYIKDKASEYLEKFIYLKKINDNERIYDFFVFVYMLKEGGIFCENNTICLQSFENLLDKYKNKEFIVGYETSFRSIEEANENNYNRLNNISRRNFISMPDSEILKKLIDFTYSNDYKELAGFINDCKTVSEYIFNNIIYKNCNINKNIQICDINVFGSGKWNKSKISVRNNYKAYSCYFENNLIEDESEQKNNLDIIILMKDNEKYLKKYFPVIRKSLSDHFKLKWFIFENGSSDFTKKLINYYFNDDDNENLEYINEHFNFKTNYKDDSIISLNPGEIPSINFDEENVTYINILKEFKRNPFIGFRCEKLAIAREKLFKLTEYENNFNKLNDEWCLLLDTDIVFDYKNSLKPLFEARDKYPDGVMFCSNCHSYAKYDDNDISKFDSNNIIDGNWLLSYYYDTFAFNYGEYIWSPKINSILQEKFKDKDVCEALTAFGGIVLIKKSVLSLSGWSTKCENAKKYKGYKIYGMSEHYSFCENVRRYGNIYIVKNSIGNWMEDDGYINVDKEIPDCNKIVKKSIVTKNLLKKYMNYENL